PYHQEGFADDMAGHLRATLKAVGEYDRYLDDLHAFSPEPVRHFDLEAIAVGIDLLKIDSSQRVLSETFIPASRIRVRHPGNDLDVLGCSLAQHQPAQRPVDDANPI